MASQTMWGLPERKNKATPPTCFNITARMGKNNIEQPLSCRAHPVAILKILDSYVRRQDGAKRTIGTLLGWISEGSVVDITDSFPVVHKDTADEGVFMDQEYHKQMLALRKKVSPREEVVGWFSTGDEINTTSAVIHGFYCSKDSEFKPTATLPAPVHLTVDTSLTQQALGIKAFMYVQPIVAPSLLQFLEVPLRVQTSTAEKSGISQLMLARRATREAQASGTVAKDIASIDGFEGGLKELLGLFRRIQEYVRAVQSGKVEGDRPVGRGLTTALCAEPVIDTEAVEKLCQSSLQDGLMVVYLSYLTRTQTLIAEKIISQFNVPQEGGGGP